PHREGRPAIIAGPRIAYNSLCARLSPSPGQRSYRDQAPFQRRGDGCRTVVDVQFPVDVDQVRFHGCLADMHLAGDLLVTAPPGDATQHLQLTITEGVGARFAQVAHHPARDRWRQPRFASRYSLDRLD